MAACQSGVADGFFQTDNSVVNDFPVLVSSGSGDSITWSIAAGSAGNNAGCDTFVAQQDKLAAQVASGLTYGLSEDGKVYPVSGIEFTTGRSVSDLNYVAWTAKASSDYTIVGSHGATRDSRYLRRVDGHLNRLAISPQSAGNTITVPSGDSISPPTGDFGASWHSSRSNQLVGGVYYYRYKVALYPSLARHLTKTKSEELCRYRFHPRGEDSHERIGRSTGRSLSGLSHADAQIADRFWCRSDLRYERRFAVEVHDLPDGIIAYAGAPASGTFTAYGRLGCYYTSQGASLRSGSTLSQCGYRFPLPQCDPNPGNGSDSDWRNYTNREIQSSGLHGKVFTKADGDYCAPQCTHNGSKRDMTNAEISEYTKDDPFFAPNTDGTTPCVKSDGPPQQAGFTADPCVTASLVIDENRIAGSAAEPGVPASDRTLVAAADRTAWDLDITSPHHNTASPPRNVASTPADATGCADGSESRADHSSDAGSAVRKNTAAGADLVLPVSSAAAQSTHPPHSKGFDSAGTDYTGAVKNIAHRYASNVAENTCAAKLAEAEMVLSEMKARRLAFQRYIDSYQSRIDAALSTSATAPLSFGNYSTNTQPGSDLGVDVLRYNAIEANHSAYVNARKDHLEFLETAVDKAETQYGTDTSGLSVPSAVPNNGCVARYDSAITALRDKIDDAETDFATVARTAGRKSVSGHLSDFKGVKLAKNPDAARVVVPTVSRPAYTWNNGSSSTAYSCPSGGRLNSNKSKCTPSISQSQAAAASTSTVTTTDQECLDNPPDDPENLWFLACYGTETVTTYSCPSPAVPAWTLSGSSCSRMVDGTPYTSTVTVTTSQSYSVTETGTVKGYFPPANSSPDKSQTFTVTFTGTRTKTVVNSGTPTYSNRTDSNNYATKSKEAENIVKGSPPTSQSALPGFAEPSITAHTDISNLSLLGKYHPQHTDRTNLKAASASDRNTAAANLGSLSAGNITTAATGAITTPQNIANTNVPTSWGGTGTTAASRHSDLQTETNDYKTAYTRAYNTAYRAALSDMGTTATTTTWNNFDWRYQQSTLAWGNYQEDPATTYSASTATPRDGTGCDLVSVASDGTVSVEATRLDYETSSYGKSSVYSTRTDAQRTCKIRRTRTPELILKYQPSRPSGTDTSKAASSFYVNYQPPVAAGQPASERFKLYDEAEVFAVKTSLADSPPVLCYQPGEALVAHVAAKGIDAVNKAVFRHASGFAGGNKKHCYRHPSLAQLVSNGKSQPAFVFFDDTAHSAMASVNVVWQQPTPKIVSKLGSADDLKMMANTVALVASSPVAYADATRTSSFYGTYYTFPTDNSVKSPSGWDITGHPSLTLASTFEQHQVQAKDTAAKTPTTHTMVFKFIDCVFGIEDVATAADIAAALAKG